MPQFTKDIFNIAPGPGRAIADPREDEARQREASARAERALQEQIQARRQSAGLQFNAQSNEMGRFMAQLGLQRDQLMAQQDESMAQRQHEMAQFEEQQRQRGIDRSFEDAFNLRSEGRLTRGQNLEQQRHGEDLDFQRNLANAGFLDAFMGRQGEMAEAERGRDFARGMAEDQQGFAREQAISRMDFEREESSRDRRQQAQIAAAPFFQEYEQAVRSGDPVAAAAAADQLNLFIRTLPPEAQRAAQDLISSMGGLSPIPTQRTGERSPLLANQYYDLSFEGLGRMYDKGVRGVDKFSEGVGDVVNWLERLGE